MSGRSSACGERLLWTQEVVGSSPAAQTSLRAHALRLGLRPTPFRRDGCSRKLAKQAYEDLRLRRHERPFARGAVVYGLGSCAFNAGKRVRVPSAPPSLNAKAYADARIIGGRVLRAFHCRRAALRSPHRPARTQGRSPLAPPRRARCRIRRPARRWDGECLRKIRPRR